MRRFRTGLAMVARMHFAVGARAVIPGIHGLPYKLGPDDVHRIEEGPLDPRAYIAIPVAPLRWLPDEHRSAAGAWSTPTARSTASTGSTSPTPP